MAVHDVHLKSVLRVQRWLPVVVVAAGMIVTFGLYQMLTQREEELVQMRFEGRAEDHVQAIETRLHSAVEAVQLLGGFYQQGVEHVSWEAFRFYVASLQNRRPELRLMLWAPRITDEQRREFEQVVPSLTGEPFRIKEQLAPGDWMPAERREVYFPIVFLYPLDMHAPLWGHDLAVHEAAYEAISAAQRTGELHATAPIVLLSDLGMIRSIGVFRPIHETDPEADAESREKRFLGVVAGVFEPRRMIEAALPLFDGASMILEIRDEHALEPANLVYDSHPDLDNDVPAPDEEQPQAEAQWMFANVQDLGDVVRPFLESAVEPVEPARSLEPYHGRIRIAGRTWHVTATATDVFVQERLTWGPSIVLVGGLAVTVLLGFYLNDVLTRTQRVEEEVAQRTRELLDTAEALRRSNELLEEFAYIASHDLQEPLRKVRSFSDMLIEEAGSNLTDPQRDYIHRMGKAAGRMQALIRGLLAYSRITTQHQPLERVDLSEIAQQVKEDLEVCIRETAGRVEIGELPIIDADPVQMRQLFQNLISNALKFHRPNVPPSVQLRAQLLPSDRCRIEVEDNGIGFGRHEVDRIFKPFQRLHERDAYDGTGMGLALCKKIVERHGGSITARSSPGEGSTFIVNLPCRHYERSVYGWRHPTHSTPAD